MSKITKAQRRMKKWVAYRCRVWKKEQMISQTPLLDMLMKLDRDKNIGKR